MRLSSLVEEAPMTGKIGFFLLMVVLSCVIGGDRVFADAHVSSPKGRGPVLLTVEGAIPNHDDDGKGPLWIMYSWDSDPALKTWPKVVHAVWQRDRLVVR